MSPAEPAADAVAPDADAEAGAMRLVEAFSAASEALPDPVRGVAVVAAVGGLIGGVLDALPDPDARRWAWQQLMHRVVEAGAKGGFVRLGCGDPGCEACSGREAGESRLTCH